MPLVYYGDGKTFKRCKCTRKAKIKNPAFEKYNRVRKEPKNLRTYVAASIVKEGHRKPGFHVSHVCHRNKKKERCIEQTHLVQETKPKNSNRTKTCLKNIMRQKTVRHFSKHGFGSLTCPNCEHDPICFLNIGRSRS